MRALSMQVPRIRVPLSLILFLALPLPGHAGPVSAEGPAEVAPIEAWERAAVELAVRHLSGDTAAWLDELAEGSPLRQLASEEALAEIRIRLGEADGASWTLQSPVSRSPDHQVSFWVEAASGLEDLVQLRFAEEEGRWKLVDVRGLAETSVLAPGLSFATSPVSAAGLGVLGLALLLLGCRGRKRAWTGLGVLLLLSCGGEKEPDAAVAADGGGGEEMVRLADLGPALEDRVAPVGSDPARMRIVDQWRARHRLLRNDLEGAEEALAGVAEDPAVAPLAGLLRARIAVARGRAEGAESHWKALLDHGADTDHLRLEAAESLIGLGRGAESGSVLRWAVAGGSRSAELWYQLARFVLVEDEDEDEGERLFRRAWQLEPIPRDRIFADPVLATLAGKNSLISLLEVSSPAEPAIAPSSPPDRPLELPDDARAWVRGDLLEVRLAGGARLALPGGSELRPEQAMVEDASTARDRSEDEVLGALADLHPVDATISQARLRTRWMTATDALERRQRYDELIELTEGLGKVAEKAPPRILRARALALLREERRREAEDLLVALGRSNIEQGRRDPVTYYDLGELVAAAGEADLALRLMERAHALAPWLGIDQRVRQLELEADLIGDYAQQESAGFVLRFPKSTEPKYLEALPLVLAAERERLGRWIPGTTEPIEVHLFPLRRFLHAYSTNVLVLGIFDGRVRVPFADLPSLHPELVAILSHELAHAMITEKTGDKAPRWFQEGLAEHVQMVQRGLNPFPDLVASDRVLAFPLVESVLEGFGGSALVGLAYEEAGWILHFIEKKWGLRGIHRMLDAFADGLGTEAAIQRALDRDLTQFEAELRAWAVGEAPGKWPTELVRYDRGWNPYFSRDSLSVAKAEEPTPRLGTRKQEAPPVDRGPTMEDRMKAWHPTYTQVVRPVKELLGPVVGAFRQGQADTGLAETCRRLGTVLPTLLDHPTALVPPDERARQPLRRAFGQLVPLSRACHQGQDVLVRKRLDDFEAQLGEAARVLGAYGLRP